MFIIAGCLCVIGLILITSEILTNKNIIKDEVSRKFVHITAGLFASTFSFYMTVEQIQLISLILLVGVVLSKHLNVFKSIHSVKRETLGEVFFALAIGLTATFASTEWIYTAAILHMSLADGLAAIVGSRYGKKSSYKVFGQTKSLIGTGVFYIVSVIITTVLILGYSTGVANYAWMVAFWVPVFTAATENIAFGGLDNLLVPLVFVVVVDVVSKLYI